MGIPSRGEIWWVDLNPVKGHEQSGRRPGLVLSVDTFNHGPAGMAIIIPVTKTDRKIPFHVPVCPPEGGVTVKSFIKCEDIRSISTQRLSGQLGSVSSATLKEVEDRIRILLDL